MRRGLFLIVSIIVLVSCKKKSIEFTSDGNDVAEIRLILQSDNTFNLEFQSLLDSDDPHSAYNEKYIFTGTWQIINHFYELKFKKDRGETPDLNAL